MLLRHTSSMSPACRLNMERELNAFVLTAERSSWMTKWPDIFRTRELYSIPLLHTPPLKMVLLNDSIVWASITHAQWYLTLIYLNHFGHTLFPMLATWKIGLSLALSKGLLSRYQRTRSNNLGLTMIKGIQAMMSHMQHRRYLPRGGLDGHRWINFTVRDKVRFIVFTGTCNTCTLTVRDKEKKVISLSTCEGLLIQDMKLSMDEIINTTWVNGKKEQSGMKE